MNDLLRAARDIAVRAIERSLGDVCAVDDEEEPLSADRVYVEAFALASDALLDAGFDVTTATRIATEEARRAAHM